MKKRIFLIVFLLILPTVLARQGHMPLLAVREKGGEYEGSVADLYLEVKPGTGRVFMETFPLTKLDTQISTRFAKDVACDYIGADCDKYDFFYTIKANSPIVGGPSAGAAISILTIAMLEEFELSEEIAMTGTINSGGLIGPVGSLLAKIDAAASIGIKTILIPQGESTIKEFNLTINLSEYAEKYNITIIEVSDLTSVLYEFTGKYFKDVTKNLTINKDYIETMSFLGVMLCNRTDYLQRFYSDLDVKDIELMDEDMIEAEKTAINRTKKGRMALDENKYYSAASYCFGANINYQYLITKLGNFTNFDEVRKEIEDFERAVDGVEIITVTDLEAYMVVKERLREANNSLNKAIELSGDKKDFFDSLAYAIERIYSARSWSKFFGVPGRAFDFQNNLREGCLRKFLEAQERVQYAGLFYQKSLEELEEELELIESDLEKDDYEMCLFRAAKIKAEADVILGAIGVEEEQVDTILNNKLNIVKRIIIEAQEDGMFPILGYSYYEYAKSLKDERKYTALLYAEYALELSNLKLYFKTPEETRWGVEQIQIKPEKKAPVSIIVIIAFLLGFLIALSIRMRPKVKKKR
ncbi:hypothetical protein KY331_06325 [Candidatus Woesearchaeota archaeon]|nr:hypothetical protein [Candidatus Woesearchaeota archaeon]